MSNNIIKQQDIENKIFTIRGISVMTDSDLAELYQTETKVFNQAVKRNIERFPDNFRFQLTENEHNLFLRSQSVTLENKDQSLRSQSVTIEDNRGKHRKYMPYVFTEQGVAMLSAVLRSDIAVKISIQIINAFVEMRKFIANNAGILQRLEGVEQKQISTDNKIDQIFNAIESKSLNPKQGVFYNGQIFDAYIFISDLIRTAKISITLIDNYIDDTVFTLFTKRHKNVSLSIFTKKISKQLELDIKKHNEQYGSIEVKLLKEAHDRFLIIDGTELYHIGASLKDLGKKWFAFSKFENGAVEMLEKLKV